MILLHKNPLILLMNNIAIEYCQFRGYWSKSTWWHLLVFQLQYSLSYFLSYLTRRISITTTEHNLLLVVLPVGVDVLHASSRCRRSQTLHISEVTGSLPYSLQSMHQSSLMHSAHVATEVCAVYIKGPDWRKWKCEHCLSFHFRYMNFTSGIWKLKYSWEE